MAAWCRSGNALAKLIFGLENPSGKLAMTFPRTVGQIPVFYNKHQSARVGNKNWSGLYQDIESTPMYWFGHGLNLRHLNIIICRLI